MKTKFRNLYWLLPMILAVCLAACKDKEDSTGQPYNPNRPVEITDFTPKSGGTNEQLIIYGSNFGTDKSIVSVKIGGQEALVISVGGNYIYCFTPALCYEGTIEVKVGDAPAVVYAEKYQYERQWVVSTLCGYVDDLGNGDIVAEGPFSDCGKIDNPSWFSFDPKNHDILYLTQDNGQQSSKPMRILDLKNEYIYTGINPTGMGVTRMRSISWTLSGDTMVIACTKPEQGAASNIMMARNEAAGSLTEVFTNPSRLTTSMRCQNSMIHPVNGELYYNEFASGTVFRYDFYQWGANNNAGHAETLYTIQDSDWEFNFIPHPSGKYVYMMVMNRHYILRANYDKERKTLVNPYIVCGQPGQAGYEDLVGTQARLNSPGQGVFVYNEEYAAEGKDDCYDFYFTDRDNHCIRKLTPDGVVSTFAGRGSTGMNVHANGYVDGALREDARFNYPYALAYDEETMTFYVGDVNNHRIRKIALEEFPEDEASADDDGGDEGGQATENETVTDKQ